MWFNKNKNTNSLNGAPYWYTGCCNGEQVVGISTVDFNAAYKEMNSQCSETVTNQQSGNYGTIPSISCLNSDKTTKTPDGPCSSSKPWFNYYTGECVATEEEIVPRGVVSSKKAPAKKTTAKKAPAKKAPAKKTTAKKAPAKKAPAKKKSSGGGKTNQVK
jgi:septal ring-binding cell division protein DamX